MLYREIIAVCSQIHTKHINTLCGQNVELLNVKLAVYKDPVDSTSNRNEYQDYFLGCKGGRCVGMTTLPLLCAECHEIWERQPCGTLRACPGL